MRAIIWICILGLVCLGGLVLAGFGIDRAVQAGLSATGSRAAAVVLDGLPTRFALRLEAPDLRAPGGRLGWSAAQLEAEAAVWSPLDWRVTLPPEQVLSLDGQRIAIHSDALRLNAALGLRESLPLSRAGIEAAALRLAPMAEGAGPLPDLLNLEGLSALLAAQPGSTERPAPPGGALYRLEISAARLGLPPEIATRLAARGGPALSAVDLPAELTDLGLSAEIGLARPLDRHAARGLLYPTGIDITAAGLAWGGRRIELSGPISFDAEGRPEGRLMLRLPDWRAWFDLARTMGILPENRAPMVAAIAGQLAAQSPDGVLTLPLVLRDGQMALGPVPLGPIPARLRR